MYITLGIDINKCCKVLKCLCNGEKGPYNSIDNFILSQDIALILIPCHTSEKYYSHTEN